MPNGKGFIDCRYCVYAWPTDENWPIQTGSTVKCLYHQQQLPKPTEAGAHRFCINLQANELWFSEQGGMHIYWPFLQQAARFGAELEPGMLYEYHVQLAESLRPLKLLREPDFDNRGWKQIDGEPQR
jgi:hypothetical protein